MDVSPDRRTLRTVFRDTLRSRAISLIVLPPRKCSRRIRPIVSTVSIPLPPASIQSGQCINGNGRGSILDADNPSQGGKIARRLTRGDGMTQISAKGSVITLINVFTVEPANQRRLVELLTEATEVSVRQAPGFVSASLHRSIDGTKVTMYAQWRSIDEYQAMRRDPTPLPFLQEALAISKFEPGMYEVVQTFTPLGEPN